VCAALIERRIECRPVDRFFERRDPAVECVSLSPTRLELPRQLGDIVVANIRTDLHFAGSILQLIVCSHRLDWARKVPPVAAAAERRGMQPDSSSNRPKPS
jgi:hypothetical protein